MVVTPFASTLYLNVLHSSSEKIVQESRRTTQIVSSGCLDSRTAEVRSTAASNNRGRLSKKSHADVRMIDNPPLAALGVVSVSLLHPQRMQKEFIKRARD